VRYRILPYRQGSKSAKALAEALGGKVLLLEGSKFVPKSDDVIINWGNVGNINGVLLQHLDMLENDPCVIRRASNKRAFFQLMQEAGHDAIIPAFWTSRQNIPDDAFPIVCRTSLAGHSGDGIVLSDSPAGLVDAPLYVQYIKKEQEYRVHIGKKGDSYVTIAVQRKARNSSVPDHAVNWRVRNHANGFVFVREGFTAPAAVIDAARLALGASGLDFGAVDVIWNSHQERAYVLEINTAPGLEGQTVTDYANFFGG
jgi:glutathione synthase/RimK-type ligase-like ATP-grasp enzyme